jgi:CheY-like chemotaxis protein
VILIVDNDPDFTEIALEASRATGFKGLVTPSGAMALTLARQYMPHAILLDISLPDVDGWRVMRRLKHDPAVRHIPIYIVSSADNPEQGLKLGAQGVLPKPIQTAGIFRDFLIGVRDYVDRTERRIVVVEGDEVRRNRLYDLLANPSLEVVPVDSGAAAIAALESGDIDAVVLTPDPADMSLPALAEQVLARLDRKTVYLYADGEDLTTEARHRLVHLAKEFNLHFVDTVESLIDNASLTLCMPLSRLSEEQRQSIGQVDASYSILSGKKVLIVDDDIRNIFALTSVLERHDMVTVSAETGRDAIHLLDASPDVDVVLMDIMMPEMDGIDTMKAIRKDARFRNLPIIAVTAKAMKGDREKCIEAGAWDYLAKPVDSEQMLTALRAWLTK